MSAEAAWDQAGHGEEIWTDLEVPMTTSTPCTPQSQASKS